MKHENIIGPVLEDIDNDVPKNMLHISILCKIIKNIVHYLMHYLYIAYILIIVLKIANLSYIFCSKDMQRYVLCDFKNIVNYVFKTYCIFVKCVGSTPKDT